ncbi:MAG: heavy metal-associated domain-containing protein [Planctomycetota bacterium]|nr:heavy metal-associated domain-containing protein [Planctomycetota bacterium]
MPQSTTSGPTGPVAPVVLPVLSLVFSIAGCQSGAPSAASMVDQGRPLTGASATLVVQGLSCPLCATNIDKTLTRVPGVQAAAVDLSRGEVRLTLAPDRKPTRAELAKAVRDSGFTLSEIREP